MTGSGLTERRGELAQTGLASFFFLRLNTKLSVWFSAGENTDNTLCTGTCRSSDHFNVLHVINRLGRIKGLLRNIDKMYPHCFICIAILFKHIVTHMAHSPSSASNVLYNSVVLLPCVP